MEPKWIDELDRAFLPPHDPVLHGANQSQYRPLPSVQFRDAECRTITRWTLSAEERTAIAAGTDIFLEQLLFRDATGHPNPLQPILPTVGLRDFFPKD